MSFRFSCLALAVAFVAVCLAGTAKAEISGASFVASLPGEGARAVFATHAPGRPNDLFVVDQRGLIQVLNLDTGQFNNTPFLDIQGLVEDAANEEGLLGLAFDPDFATNGYFYVNYTYPPGEGQDRTRIDRFEAINPTTATTVSSGTRHAILEFNQDFSNHNGGWIGFSPADNYLYIASGDGGSGNDPNNRAQRLNTRLGKMLRIDPRGDDFPLDATENYSVPADNPFVDGDASTLDEIWAYGLRNPWRSSFDRDTGDLWIGDVGQNAREEINFQSVNSSGGEHYGWRLREGDIATPTGGVGGPEPVDHAPPVYDYLHGGGTFQGNSVVGGYVYRGPDPEVEGRYFFADTSGSRYWTFDPSDPDGTVQNISSLLSNSVIRTPVSFGEDTNGNLYIVTLFNGIYRIETDALAAGDYDADGDVDADDFAAWQANFGAVDSLADANQDGVVDGIDYAIWRESLPIAGYGAEVVPEPSALHLATGFVAILILMSLLRNRFDSRATIGNSQAP